MIEQRNVTDGCKDKLLARNGDGPTSHIPAHESTAVAAPFRA